jgi:hypothetical protein
MIMCIAVDTNAMPREVQDFIGKDIGEDVFVGGRIKELNNDWWVELRERVPIRRVIPPEG